MNQRILILASLFGLSLAAAPVILDGYIPPVPGAFTQVPDGQETRLRSPQTVLLGVDEGEALAFTIRCHRVGQYVNEAAWKLSDASGAEVQQGVVPLGESQEITVPDAKPGVYSLSIDAKSNAYTVRTPLHGLTLMAGGPSLLRAVYQVPTLYFWVPDGAHEVRVAVHGQGDREQAAYVVRRADGTVLVESDSRQNQGLSTLSVAPGTAGEVWSIELGQLADYTFEDVSLELSGDLVPVVAEAPQRLLVPVLSTFASPNAEGAEFGLRLMATPKLLQNRTLHYTVREVGENTVFEDKTVAQPVPGVISTKVVRPGFLHAEIAGELLDGEGQTVVRTATKLAVAHGHQYTEVENREDHPVAAASWADHQVGYQVFRRAEPGDIRPNSTPREDELVTELPVRVTPGEFETLYFALQPLRDLPETTLQVGGFTGATGEAAPITCELRTVRCWPQLTDWRSPTFHVIPELLEQGGPIDLRQGRPQQYALILHVPADQAAGTYSAPVEMTGKGQRSRALLVQLEVLPFHLEAPSGITWGLYPDTARWASFPEAQIAAELAAFREHGMNALMMYPMGSAKWEWKDGVLTADFSRFRTQMRLYKEAGLGGPMVISIQGSEGFITRLTGYKRETDDEQFWGAYRQLLAILRREGTEQQWPEYVIHSVDEPHSGPTLAEAIRTLSVIKEAGFRTFNTCYGKAVRESLDPYLDYRCYNNIGFLSMVTPEATQALREETLASHDVFWWYGTGCYTNGHLIQDGNTLVNRFMGGLHFWRTGATGCWSWTFLRPKNSAYDDFDGSSQRESKDACIAYPTPDGKALVPTLQWEGLREGVDDYRYLYTLKSLIRKAEGKAGRAGEAAAQADRQIDAAIQAMPWNCREGGTTTADLDRFRALVINQILAVGQAME